MNGQNTIPILEKIRPEFRRIAESNGLLDADVLVLGTPLTPEEAIGTPGRRDFPIIIGKERILEATVEGARGQAYTDSAREFSGRLGDVLEMTLDSNQSRAIYVATLNAVLARLKMAKGTVHCKDDDPEVCALEISRYLRERYGDTTVGMIGLNPAIAERIVDTFTPARVRMSDLYEGNIGKTRFGVEVWDGHTRTDELIEASGVVVFTGSTLLNGTFDHILDTIRGGGKEYLIFGVTAAGVCELEGLNITCPCGRNG
jgi:uncharacterized protein (DUF4213/DUF364 family)